jgi:hypothetical protein
VFWLLQAQSMEVRWTRRKSHAQSFCLWHCPERSEGRGGTSTRSHGAQAGRSATQEPDFARRANDSRRQSRPHRAEAGGVGCSA